MNIPDPAIYASTVFAVIYWIGKTFVKERLDGGLRQIQHDQKEQLEIDALKDRKDRKENPNTPAFLSVADWHLVVDEVTKITRTWINELRADLEVDRSKRDEEMKMWINGSFMRSGVVMAKLETIYSKLDDMSNRLERLDKR